MIGAVCHSFCDSFTFPTASTYECQQEYDLAIADYTKAIKVNPDDYFAIKWRADVYMQTEEYDDAIEDYEKALTLTEDAEEIKQCRERIREAKNAR
jgi:tetratricopeptide (TPR) repeat protein